MESCYAEWCIYDLLDLALWTSDPAYGSLTLKIDECGRATKPLEI